MTRIDGITIDLYREFAGHRDIKIDPAIPGVEEHVRAILALNDAELLRLARNATNEGIMP